MKTHLEKTQANRVSADRQESQSAVNRASQKRATSKPTSQLVDNRPEAIQARELQQLADSSSQGQAAQLQAMADNNAARQQLPYQLKTKPFVVDKKIPAKLGISYLEYKGLQGDEYNKFMYNRLRSIYNESMAKGCGYWQKFLDAVKEYNEVSDGNIVKELMEKRSVYDTNFKEFYKSTVNKSREKYNPSVATKGLGYPVNSDNNGGNSTSDAPILVPYNNHFDFRQHTIIAANNYVSNDLTRISDAELMKLSDGYKPKGLPNSEILWQQYKMAAGKQFIFKKELKAKSLMRNLSAVSRENVQNPATLATILFALPDDKPNLSCSHTFGVDTEEFLAIVGTPNGSGAVYLLLDHMDELEGKSIREIEWIGKMNDVMPQRLITKFDK